MRSPKNIVPLTWRWCGSLLTGTDWVDRLNCVIRVSLIGTNSSGTTSLERFRELWGARDDWGRTIPGANDESTGTGRRSSFYSVTACASHSDSIHSNLLLMLRWIASDWCLEGADKCNSSSSCSRLTGCTSISKFPWGFWVVKSVRAWAASLIEVNPVRICTDGEPGSWAIAAIFWRVSACHSAICSINACCCCCWCCCSWKTWGIVSAEAGAGPTIRGNCERWRGWIDSHFCSCFFVDSLAFSWHVLR